ncbi:MAG TPA: hypothetical protein VK158_04635 [Acidobacteriota bacterium]|nr:hypothetical protein [Acidobacteriota bacterium]
MHKSFFQKNENRLNITVFVVLSVALLSAMLILSPYRQGDGNEYYLTALSFVNHDSPDLQEIDLSEYYKEGVNPFGQRTLSNYTGYVSTSDGKLYSSHFWAYSLISARVMKLLILTHFDPYKALQITNALLLITALFFIHFLSTFSFGQKITYSLLLLTSPILLYLRWSHVEIFIASFLVMSLVCLHKNWQTLALIFAIFASFQHQAVLVYVLFVCINAMYRQNWRLKLYQVFFLAFALIPSFFYLWNFGQINVIDGHISIAYWSFLKVIELFLDANIGMISFIPISMLLVPIVVGYSYIAERKWLMDYTLIVVVFCIAILCALQLNWNHGSAGPSRYTVLLMPFFFFIIVRQISYLRPIKFIPYVLIVIIASQAFIVGISDLNVRHSTYLSHTTLARIMLGVFPEMYNPTHEIFCERTLKREGGVSNVCFNTAIYIVNGTCKKALVSCAQYGEVVNLCDDALSELNCNGSLENSTAYYLNPRRV